MKIISKPSHSGLIVALIAVLALAVVPVGAGAANAHAASNDANSAASSLYAVMVSSGNWAKQLRGRTLETACRKSSKYAYNCQWWTVKGRRDNRKATSAEIVSRLGSGTRHNKASNVYDSGIAQATYKPAKRGFTVWAEKPHYS